MTKRGHYWLKGALEWTVAVFGMNEGPDKYRAFNTVNGEYGGPMRDTYIQAYEDIKLQEKGTTHG